MVTLSSVRVRLEHVLLTLLDQRDDDGTLLRHEVRALLGVAELMRDVPGADLDAVVERMKILVSHVREYAEREGIYLGSGTMSETVVMSLEDVRRAMGTGSTAPPPSVAELIAEAQGLSPESEHPAPPSRPTLPDLE